MSEEEKVVEEPVIEEPTTEEEKLVASMREPLGLEEGDEPIQEVSYDGKCE